MLRIISSNKFSPVGRYERESWEGGRYERQMEESANFDCVMKRVKILKYANKNTQKSRNIS